MQISILKCLDGTKKLTPSLHLIFIFLLFTKIAARSDNYEFEVKENSQAGTVVGNFNPDQNNPDSFDQLLFDGDPNYQFIQSSFDSRAFTRGVVKTSRMLDHEDVARVEMKFHNLRTRKFFKVCGLQVCIKSLGLVLLVIFKFYCIAFYSSTYYGVML